MIFEHAADAIAEPSLIRLSDDFFAVRFESMKILSAVEAVRGLLASEHIDRDTTLVDSSSGIYAYALALAAHKFGLKAHIIASTAADSSLLMQLEILGATYEQMPKTDSLRLDQSARIRRVKDFIAKNYNSHWMKQYHDGIHRRGYEILAKKIAPMLSAYTGIDLYASVGSGASSSGLYFGLQQHSFHVRLFGIQPFGSVTFGAEHVDDPDILIAGIGSSIEFENVIHELYDEIHWIAFECACEGTIELLRDSGLYAGLSSGAAYLAARVAGPSRQEVARLVVLPDTGFRYTAALCGYLEQNERKNTLVPAYVQDHTGIHMPWSAMKWNHRKWNLVTNGQD